MERTIKVTGRGKITARPDLMVLVLNQNGTCKTYEQAYSLSANAKTELDKVMESLHISNDLFKTTSFDINPDYRSIEKDGIWSQELVGYTYNHNMELRLDLDNELLSIVFNKLKDMKHVPSINIRYSLKDQESFKNELIANAVKDSKEKALALTKALDVELGEVMSIDYSWSNIEVYSRFERMDARLMKCNEVAMNINPEDIELEDTVSVVWSIG